MPAPFRAAALGALLAVPSLAQQPESPVGGDETGDPILLSYGQHTVGFAISPTLDTDRFVFSGEEGDRVWLILDGKSNAFDPRMRLLDPVGQEIEVKHCDPGCCTTCTVVIDQVLPADGFYTVLVSDNQDNEIGNYTLQLESVPPKTPVPGLDYNSVLADRIDPATDVDVFRFEGKANTQVKVSMDGMSNAFDPRIRLLDPSGSMVNQHCDPGCCTTCTTSISASLTVDGTYYVILSDSGYNEVGNYSVGLSCDFGFCPPTAQGLTADVDELSLAIGGVQTLTLDAGADQAGDFHLVLSSLSGFIPGILIDGFLLPVNPDPWFFQTLQNPSAPPAGGFFGLLDINGSATATFTVPRMASPSLAGLVVHHAFVVIDGQGGPFIQDTSNAVALELLP